MQQQIEIYSTITPKTESYKQESTVKINPEVQKQTQAVIPTRCEGGETAPLSLLRREPCLGLGAGLPQRKGEMLRSDPGWAQQSHHVQTQREEDAQQGDQLEGSEHVHLVHRHLLI